MALAGLNYKKIGVSKSRWTVPLSEKTFHCFHIRVGSGSGQNEIGAAPVLCLGSSTNIRYSVPCVFVGISTDLLLEFRSVSAVIYLQQLYWGICEDCSGWDQQNLFVDSLSGDRSNAVYFGFGIFLELVGIPTVCDIGLALYSKVGLSFSDGISRTDIYSSANRLHVFSPYFLNPYHFVLRILRWDSIKNENHRWIGFVL